MPDWNVVICCLVTVLACLAFYRPQADEISLQKTVTDLRITFAKQAAELVILKERTSDLTWLRQTVHEVDVNTKKHSLEIQVLDTIIKQLQKSLEAVIVDLKAMNNKDRSSYSLWNIYDFILAVAKRLLQAFRFYALPKNGSSKRGTKMAVITVCGVLVLYIF